MKNKGYYSKDFPHECRFCERGTVVPDKSAVVCMKKGIVPVDGCCRKYVFDPLKREPMTVKNTETFSPEDFSID